ncbi:MAG TPA: 2-oxoglutarate dehydrogenase E1 component [Alphaproteobacteria bacterium]
MSRTQELELTTFLAGANGAFIEELYARYVKDPASVDPGWRAFFASLADEAPSVLKELEGASWSPRRTRVIGAANGAEPARKGNGAASAEVETAAIRKAASDSIRALMLIRSYRVRGHLACRLDPLGLQPPMEHPELDPASYGFTEADLDRHIFIDNVLRLEYPTLREIIARLRATYCGSIGVEYMHIQEADQKDWIQERIEAIENRTAFTEMGKRAILERLTQAELFEQFLNVKYPGTKRFGLDGGESLIPGLEQILKRGSQLGVEEVVIGMPHRGRLNVLAQVMSKPFRTIFAEFEGMSSVPDDVGGSGDVKYHLGTSADREFDGKVVHLSLNANPSHLEAVNPVVVGRVRAKQRQKGDRERRKVLGLLMHGDAAFAGQGLVAETFDLSDIKGYRTGGTVHFIVNNQIGFTTNPSQTRRSPYPSEMAKIVQAPIFHVNGDDAEAVVHVSRVATEFRHQFRKDVVIDMWCYRRHGHNEGDEPMFTQPRMYKAIARQQTTRALYAEQLAAEGVVPAAESKSLAEEFRKRLEQDFEAAKGYKPNKADWLEGVWSGYETAPTVDDRRGTTDLPLEVVREVGLLTTNVPAGFNVNPKIVRMLQARREAIEAGKDIDWATAEAIAFGTLLLEGHMVRISGQDSARGTFSQRHAALIDQETGARYLPLAHLKPGQARFVALDSPLSEAGVLGFEYGYSLTAPDALILWEAQFGDFANGAQVIIDQFIASAEAKWLRMSGLVMLLPHGNEGQGPEHSSARIERFLQLSAGDNWQVVNATTPAQYAHALRRQIHRKFRKPLVVMTPKSLLRHKLCVSRIAEFGPGTCFHRVIGETHPIAAPDKVRRVVLCSGKVYYDLLAAREDKRIGDVALVRVEQLYPFPVRSLTAELAKYPNAEVVWCQEEPHNMGAWLFMDRRIEAVLAGIGGNASRPVYVGRPESAATATGSYKRHNEEQKRLVADALA